MYTLLRVLRDLDAMQDDLFDPVSILEKLDTVNLLEWPGLLPCSTPPVVGPVLALQSVSDVYEVQEAADLIGRLMFIKVEACQYPRVCTTSHFFNNRAYSTRFHVVDNQGILLIANEVL